jgi:serine/threonine-protein kinase HipA
MGRPSSRRALGVWWNGVRVATWTLGPRAPMELLYDREWTETEDARPLSLSLPINLDGVALRGPAVEAYFDNLLPDSESIRRRVQARFRTASTSAFDLLTAIGRDCIGAVQLLPEDEAPTGVRRIEVEPLTDAAIEAHLRATTSPPVPGGDDDDAFRISVAGAQEKSAFTFHEGRFCRPHGATPTTHIFKLPLGVVGGRQIDLSTSLENEWLCAEILRRLGVPMAACEIQRFGATKALVVERFDRRLESGGRYWLRLPQEDFCQATGTPSASKYESDGGPGLLAIASILRGAESPENDLGTLLRAQLAFWLLGAPDGHAKNFSIHLLAQGRYRLTPLYDVISAWPVVGARANQIPPQKLRLAMALHGKTKHYRVHDIARRHFNETAQRCGYGRDMNDLIDDMAHLGSSVVDEVGDALPKGFPAKVYDTIVKRVKLSAKSL